VGKGQVIYIGLCEMLLALVVGLIMAAFLVAKMYSAAATSLAVSIGLATVAVGFLRRRTWAWYVSWAIGAMTIALGGWMLWAAAYASPGGDGGDVVVLVVPMLVMALAASRIMLLYSFRELAFLGGRRSGDAARAGS
jgi:hypothetical protein